MYQGARARLVGGIVMLAVPVTLGLAALVHLRYLSDMVLLELLDNPALLLVVGLVFTVSALPLLVPQRVPPPDIRHNRWYMSVGMCLTGLQLVFFVEPVVPREVLDQTTDGDRAVVLYHPDTEHACLRIWKGYGAAARVVGDIGAAGRFTEAHFRDRDTIVLVPGRGDTVVLLPHQVNTGYEARTIRLHPRTGRPLDHTGRCVTRWR